MLSPDTEHAWSEAFNQERGRLLAALGSITGGGTFVGGILHTLPFLIPHYRAAIILAIIVVGFELVTLAWLRWRYFEVSFARALATVTLGGVVIAAVSAGLGTAA